MTAIKISVVDEAVGINLSHEITMAEYREWTNKGDKTTLIIIWMLEQMTSEMLKKEKVLLAQLERIRSL